ncbi:MAG: kelch repeat-containing protein [Chryseosolibacter sp.]
MKCTSPSHVLTCIALLITLFISNNNVVAQENQWTWMSGSDSPFQEGVYGTKGVSAFSNVPGGRWAARGWTDDSGDLWLFGGQEEHQDAEQGFRNDLWRYSVSLKQWTWMSGDTIIDQSAVYGIEGVENADNKPGANAATLVAKDEEGNLWMFGGGGFASGVFGYQNDLWKYNISNEAWTWMSGDAEVNKAGVYGTRGVANATNQPGARATGVSWMDNDGNFWIFGGLGYAFNGEFGLLNDLWKYNIGTNEWTWMRGDDRISDDGVYGTKGMAHESNEPGARGALIGWTDMDGNLWLFGGFGNGGYMNDLWKYEPATNLWTWMSGDDIPNQAGVYGTQGMPDAANKPGARSSSSASVGKNGEFWMFGGYDPSAGGRINDLWKYEPATNLWTWISGDQTGWQEGIYGTKGKADPDNKPGARDEPVLWADKDGDVWMFGGRYSSEAYGVFNDLWKYEVATQRNGVCCFTGENGEMVTCGPNVNAVNCMGSGANAFFVGYVSDCSVIDASTLCSVTTEAVSLSAEYVEVSNSVRLAWQLPSERQTRGFFIQRSINGSAFKNIGFMPVNSSGNYDFVDVYPLLQGYYKVVWFEQQGFESNDVFAVATESDDLQLFPNPSGLKVRLLIKDIQANDINVSVYNNTGRQVLTQRLDEADDPYIDISFLTPGLYYIRAEINRKIYYLKFLKE